jgi:hypothetical protein
MVFLASVSFIVFLLLMFEQGVVVHLQVWELAGLAEFSKCQINSFEDLCDNFTATFDFEDSDGIYHIVHSVYVLIF